MFAPGVSIGISIRSDTVKNLWRDFMKSLVATFSVILIMFLASCDSSDEKSESSENECTRGEETPCTCPDGSSSTKVCLSDDEYSECECNNAVVCNDPGAKLDCDCPNGGEGVQVCLNTGYLSVCNCPDSGKCCYNLGTCLSEDMVVDATSESLAESLSEDTCGTDRGLLCVPDDFAAGNAPEFCKSVLDSEGRCLPDCLPAVAEITTPLPQSTCPEHFRCVPCYDPFSGTMTDACLTVEGDTPRSVGKSFDSCCGSNGFCVPVDLLELSDEQLEPLGKDSCDPDQNVMCVPKVFIDNPDFVPDVCVSIAESEGRCLPECLPSINELAVTLPQDSCPDDFVCAPCFDPFTGELTDACTLPGDPGPSVEPAPFDECCKGLGSCVPADILSEDQTAMLDEESCERDKDLVCVPSIFTGSDGYQPQPCVSLNREEGRCLPNCIPEIAEYPIDLPQDVCPEDFVCAPCYDPTTLQVTDACTVEGDLPNRTPMGYDTCCYGLGSCVPMRLVPEEQRLCVDEDVCTPNADLLCVPNEAIDFGNYTPDFCTSIFDSDGYCAPKCSPDARKLDFPQDVCRDDFVCVPYTNPQSGIENQCEFKFPDNKQWEDQIEFPKCCKSSGKTYGTCVPLDLMSESVDEIVIENFPADDCPSGKDYRCVPDVIAEDPNNFEFKPCTGVTPIDVAQLVALMDVLLELMGQPALNLEDLLDAAGIDTIGIEDAGVCISECLLQETDTNGMVRDICGPHELCVPCTFAGIQIPGICSF